MKGIFSLLPKALEEALHPISLFCAHHNWAIDLQSGPLNEIYFTEKNDSRNILHLFYDFPESAPPAWFRKGILPKHANDLILDEWGYYLGFKSETIKACELWHLIGNNLSPRKTLFDIVAEKDLIYIIFADDGWWEVYCKDPDINSILMASWGEKFVDSDRWDGPHDQFCP